MKKFLISLAVILLLWFWVLYFSEDSLKEERDQYTYFTTSYKTSFMSKKAMYAQKYSIKDIVNNLTFESLFWLKIKETMYINTKDSLNWLSIWENEVIVVIYSPELNLDTLDLDKSEEYRERGWNMDSNWEILYITSSEKNKEKIKNILLEYKDETTYGNNFSLSVNFF